MLWYLQVCLLLLLPLHFITQLKQTSELAPPWDVLVKSRIEAVTHKAHKLFLLRHQALKQMHPICTHPLWTGHSWGYTPHNTPTHRSIGHPANMWDKWPNAAFEHGESYHSFQTMGSQHKEHIAIQNTRNFPAIPDKTAAEFKFHNLLCSTHPKQATRVTPSTSSEQPTRWKAHFPDTS